MLIKHLAKFAALAMALSLWSCSENDLTDDGQIAKEEGEFYATVTLHLPTASGSRSETIEPDDYPAQSDNGFEVGRNSENSVTSVLVVLATKDEKGDYKWISKASTVAENLPPATGTNHLNEYLLRFRSNELIEAAEKGLITPTTTGSGEVEVPGKPLYVFVYCNPPSSFKTTMSAAYFSPLTATNLRTDLTGDAYTDLSIEIPQLTEQQQLAATPIRNSITQANLFLMTNAELSSYTFEGPDIAATLRTHNKPANALNIGEVRVERASCRFDYKPSGAFEVKYNDDVYASIEINGMALFNESKNFYMFPRVTKGASASTAPDQWILCGQETPINWVVSPNWDKMDNYSGSTGQAISNLFNYATTKKSGNAAAALPRSFTYTSVSDKSLDDNHEATVPNKPWSDPGENEGYKIWRYTTENTIPGIDIQKNGISTGIYFRAKLNPIDNAEEGTLAYNIKAAMEKRQPIFAYSDNLESGQNNTADIHTLLGSAQDLFDYVAATSVSQQSEIAKGFLQGFKYGFFIITPEGGTAPLSTNLDINKAEDLEKIFTKTNTVTIPSKYNTLTNSQIITTITVTEEDGNTTATTSKDIYLKDLGFYAYYATGNEYLVYYPYYNRHNDNHDNYDMGQMEFATVRNNIYKLNVTNITRIGLPGDVPPDPDTPDESEDVYIQVKVKVLDWVVRINNIEF